MTKRQMDLIIIKSNMDEIRKNDDTQLDYMITIMINEERFTMKKRVSLVSSLLQDMQDEYEYEYDENEDYIPITIPLPGYGGPDGYQTKETLKKFHNGFKKVLEYMKHFSYKNPTEIIKDEIKKGKIKDWLSIPKDKDGNFLEFYKTPKSYPAPSEIPTPLKSHIENYLTDWEKNYITMDIVLLIDCIKTANYMNMIPLLKLLCGRLWSYNLNGKSTDELKEVFDIKSNVVRGGIGWFEDKWVDKRYIEGEWVKDEFRSSGARYRRGDLGLTDMIIENIIEDSKRKCAEVGPHIT